MQVIKMDEYINYHDEETNEDYRLRIKYRIPRIPNKLDTSRKQFGMQKGRIQIPDPDTGKWGIIYTNSNELIRISSRHGQSYKGIKKVFPYIRDTETRQCCTLTKNGRRCRNLTINPSGLCYFYKEEFQKVGEKLSEILKEDIKIKK